MLAKAVTDVLTIIMIGGRGHVIWSHYYFWLRGVKSMVSLDWGCPGLYRGGPQPWSAMKAWIKVWEVEWRPEPGLWFLGWKKAALAIWLTWALGGGGEAAKNNSKVADVCGGRQRGVIAGKADGTSGSGEGFGTSGNNLSLVCGSWLVSMSPDLISGRNFGRNREESLWRRGEHEYEQIWRIWDAFGEDRGGQA